MTQMYKIIIFGKMDQIKEMKKAKCNDQLMKFKSHLMQTNCRGRNKEVDFGFNGRKDCRKISLYEANADDLFIVHVLAHFDITHKTNQPEKTEYDYE